MFLRHLRGILGAVAALVLATKTVVAGGVSPPPLNSAWLDLSFGYAVGSMLCRTSTTWAIVAAGSPSQVLTVPSAGGCPSWATPASGGNVSTAGTPSAGQIALFTNTTTVQGVNLLPVSAGGTGAAMAAANAMFAGPASGSTAAPSFRALVTADLPMAALAYGGLKNRLFNGAMAIDQRFVGAAATLGTAAAYTVDRWFGWTGTSPASETAQRVAVLSGGVAYAERLARGSGASATAAVNLGQVLETLPNIDLQGRTVTLSLKARAGANFSGPGLACRVATGTGTDQGSASFASAGWTGYAVAGSATFALTTSFQTFALQATIPASATEIGVSCGYTPSGTAGSADYADLTDVQLEPGAFTAGQVTFERRPLNVETALCQRFFVQWTTTTRADLASGLAYSSTATVFPMPLPVPMRATPAIGSSTVAVLNGSGGQINGSSQAVQAATDKTVEIAIGASGLTLGQASVLTIGTGSGGYLSLNSEL